MRSGVLILSQTLVTRIMTSMKKDVVSIMTCYQPNDAWTSHTPPASINLKRGCADVEVARC